MRRAALVLYLAAMAMPASADECAELHHALEVYRIATDIYRVANEPLGDAWWAKTKARIQLETAASAALENATPEARELAAIAYATVERARDLLQELATATDDTSVDDWTSESLEALFASQEEALVAAEDAERVYFSTVQQLVCK